MKLVLAYILGAATMLFAAQSSVKYAHSVATPKQTKTAIEILAEGLQAIDKKLVKKEVKAGKLILSIDLEKLNAANALIGRISHTTTGKERQEQIKANTASKDVKAYDSYYRKVSKAKKFIRGNRRIVEKTNAQVCVDLHLVDTPPYDMDTEDLAEIRWDNEINGVDIVDSVTYNGNPEMAAEIIMRNQDIFEDDEYFYIRDVVVSGDDIKIYGYYFDDYESDEPDQEFTVGKGSCPKASGQ